MGSLTRIYAKYVGIGAALVILLSILKYEILAVGFVTDAAIVMVVMMIVIYFAVRAGYHAGMQAEGGYESLP